MSDETLTFRLFVQTDSDAFYDNDGNYNPATELAFLLRAVADRLDSDAGDFRDHWAYQMLRDTNGNDVGRYGLKRGSLAEAMRGES